MFFTIIGIGVFTYGVAYAVAVTLLDCDLQTAIYERFGKSVRKLKGQVVIITGASSGIGEGIAIALAKGGAKLVLTARRANELERVKKICLDVSKGQLSDRDILVIPMDITDLAQHKRTFDHALHHFGNIDILVNNAGRSQRAIFENIDLTVDKQMFDLNLFAVVNLTRIAVNYFNTKGRGHVAVVSSLAGIIGVPYSASYTGTKHAIHGYFNALRSEKVGRSLAVSLLCPGPTYTNFLSESFTEKPNQKYGISAQETDRRMTTERCGQLCAISLVNRQSESWMGRFPMVLFTYVAVYFPLVYTFVLKTVGPEKLFKLRDSQDLKLQEQ